MFIPRKSQRDYIKPLWKMKQDGSKGELVCHSCARCGRQVDGKEKGTWFEYAEEAGLWRFVCSKCYPKRQTTEAGEMSKEHQIREAISLIWRNTQPHTTFGPCQNGCKIGGRGTGPCIECAESQLAKLTSRDVAKRYVMAVKAVRRIEGEMIG